MEMLRSIVRLLISISCLALAACSGGGGGSASTTTPVTTSSVPSPTPAPPPVASIDRALPASLNGNSPLIATGSGPNFTTSPPAIGTVFPLNQSVLALTQTSVGGFAATGGATATLQGTQTVNGTKEGLFRLQVPSIGLDVSNLVSDGTSMTLPDGRNTGMILSSMNYTLFGSWKLTPATSGTGYLGFFTSGYQTPPSGLPGPLTGTADYIGNSASSSATDAGGTVGLVMVPGEGGGIAAATLKGDVAITVVWGPGNVSGHLRNMTATPVGGGTATPFSTIVFNGNLSGTTMSGQTGVGAATSGNAVLPTGQNTGPYSFAGGVGTFSGTFYGPTAQELGGVWSVYSPDATGFNKSAVGIFGATKQ